MTRKLRQVKSEIQPKSTSRKIKTQRTKTPLRFSRRLRQLPPEHLEYYNEIRYRLKVEKLEGKQVISQESSIQFRPSRKANRQRKLHYPQKVRNPKEVVNILSAPKIINKKGNQDKKVMELYMKVRGSSCKPKMVVKNPNPLRSHYTVSKHTLNIKREPSPGAEKVLKRRKQYVLEVLNNGNMKDIEKLPSVGCKTAERIILYRQLKGSINRISELAKMPKFPKKRFQNFVAQNFLRVD